MLKKRIKSVEMEVAFKFTPKGNWDPDSADYIERVIEKLESLGEISDVELGDVMDVEEEEYT